MIFLVVYDMSVAALEFEGDAPSTIHMDLVTGRVMTLQTVKVETGKVLYPLAQLQHRERPDGGGCDCACARGFLKFPFRTGLSAACLQSSLSF